MQEDLVLWVTNADTVEAKASDAPLVVVETLSRSRWYILYETCVVCASARSITLSCYTGINHIWLKVRAFLVRF